MNLSEIAPAVLTPEERQRLVNLAAWAAGEDAKRRLGLPSEWNQPAWFSAAGCGTTCCIAGKVALEDGAVPVLFDNDGERVSAKKAAKLWYGPMEKLKRYDVADEEVYVPGEDEPVVVLAYAAEALGLTQRQALFLFDGTNTLEEVLGVIARFLGTPLRPADVN